MSAANPRTQALPPRLPNRLLTSSKRKAMLRGPCLKMRDINRIG